MAIVVISYEAKPAARRALTFIVRIFVNDTIAITVWASLCFHVTTVAQGCGPGPNLGQPSNRFTVIRRDVADGEPEGLPR
jgi:hypothetical protein